MENAIFTSSRELSGDRDGPISRCGTIYYDRGNLVKNRPGQIVYDEAGSLQFARKTIHDLGRIFHKSGVNIGENVRDAPSLVVSVVPFRCKHFRIYVRNK